MYSASIFLIGILYFLRLLTWLIIIRILISWIAPGTRNPIAVFIIQTVEPILKFFRGILPRGKGQMAMIDWSPLVAIIALDLLRYLVISVFV